jgi:glycosyltransferase involved in cell wall biosynthesis
VKILIIHNQYIYLGGEDKVVENEISLLRQHGHVVQTLIFNNDNLSEANPARKLKQGLNALFNFESRKRVQASIAEFGPDVIHVHNLFFNASPSVLYSVGKKIPIIFTLHNFRLVCANGVFLRDGKPCELCLKKVMPLDGIRNRCYRQSLTETALLTSITSLHKVLNTWNKKVDKYICLTEFAKKKILASSLQLSPEQIEVKPNFVRDPGCNLEEREDFFLFVGRLSREKGIDVLLESARQGNYHLKIIGEGPEQHKVIEAAKVNPRIEYLGYQQFPVILTYLQRCLAILVPSIWYEGFPVTIVEAFAAGTPVIASDLGSMAVIVQDHSNGFLFEAGNYLQLNEKIDYLLANKQALKSLNMNARQAYLDNYCPEKNYQRLMEIYQSVLNK